MTGRPDGTEQRQRLWRETIEGCEAMADVYLEIEREYHLLEEEIEERYLQDGDDVTAALDRIYATEPSSHDPVLMKMQMISLDKETWDKETLFLAEIHTRFDSEWVLLENPETTPSLGVTGGRGLWHSKDRDEIYHKAR